MNAITCSYCGQMVLPGFEKWALSRTLVVAQLWDREDGSYFWACSAHFPPLQVQPFDFESGQYYGLGLGRDVR